MSTYAPVSFIQQYDAEVKQVYQQRASLLRGTVRTRTNVGAERIYFPILGKGDATTKARHADVVPMNLEHDRRYADMRDYFAPEYADDLDMDKINWSLVSEYSQAAGMALGRRTDAILFEAMNQTPNEQVAADTPDSNGEITLRVITQASRNLTELDVPADRDRFFVVSPEGLQELLEITGATSSDFVREQLLVTGQAPAFWMGFSWIVHTNLPDGVKGFYYHRQAVGHGISRDINSEVAWISQKDSWLIKAKMSMGATIIDDDGVFRLVATS